MTSTQISSPTGCGTYVLIGILAVVLTVASGQIVRLQAVDCTPMTDYPPCAPEAGFPFVFVQDDYSTWSTLGHTGVMDWEDYFGLRPWPFAGNVLVYSVLLLFGWWGLRLRATHQIPTGLRLLAPFATMAVLALVAASFNFRPYRPGPLPTPTPIPAQFTLIQRQWQLREADTGRSFTLKFEPANRAVLHLPERSMLGSYTWHDASTLTLDLNAYAALETPLPLQCDQLPAFLSDTCQLRQVAYAGPVLEGRLIAPPPVASYPYSAPPAPITVDAVYQQVWGVFRVQVDATTLTLSNDAGIHQAFAAVP